MGDARSLLGNDHPVLYILYMLYKQSKVFKPKCLRGEGRPAPGNLASPGVSVDTGTGPGPKNGAVHPQMRGHIRSHGDAAHPVPPEPDRPTHGHRACPVLSVSFETIGDSRGSLETLC